MNLSLKRPIIGVLVAIAVTTAMDANGLAAFSALPLLLLTGVLWYWERLSRREMGLVWGGLRYHGLAVFYPLMVLGTITVIVFLLGAVDLSSADWKKASLNMGLMSSTGVIAVLLTEEGFFRGWLWASLKRARLNDRQVLVWSSIAFAVWHISAVSLETGFDLPAPQIPVYLLNVVVIGAIWGMLRLISGSVLVASVSHAVWNGLDYPLFGFGTKIGTLGITETAIYGPEVGILGLIANVVFAAALWRWVNQHNIRTAQKPLNQIAP